MSSGGLLGPDLQVPGDGDLERAARNVGVLLDVVDDVVVVAGSAESEDVEAGLRRDLVARDLRVVEPANQPCALRRLAPRAHGQLEIAVGQELAATVAPPPPRPPPPAPAAPAAAAPAGLPVPRLPPPALPARSRPARRRPSPARPYPPRRGSRARRPAAFPRRRPRRRPPVPYQPHRPVPCPPRRRHFLRRRPARPPPAPATPVPAAPADRPRTRGAAGVSGAAAAPPAVTSLLPAPPSVSTPMSPQESAQRPGQNTPNNDCVPHT